MHCLLQLHSKRNSSARSHHVLQNFVIVILNCLCTLLLLLLFLTQFSHTSCFSCFCRGIAFLLNEFVFYFNCILFSLFIYFLRFFAVSCFVMHMHTASTYYCCYLFNFLYLNFFITLVVSVAVACRSDGCVCVSLNLIFKSQAPRFKAHTHTHAFATLLA